MRRADRAAGELSLLGHLPRAYRHHPTAKISLWLRHFQRIGTDQARITAENFRYWG